MIMAGTAMPATSAMPTGAPTSVPSCQRSFFLRDHGFLPQNVHPDGLKKIKLENAHKQKFIYYSLTSTLDNVDH